MTPLSSLARRLFPLIEGLFPLIASRLLPGHPATHLLFALHKAFRRALARFDRLAHRWETNTLLPPRPARPRKPADPEATPEAAPKPRLRFSSKNGWLLDQFPFAIRYQAALCNARLQTILDDPEVKALRAAIPRAESILRPMAKMLAVPLPRPKRPGKPRAPKPPKPERPPPHRSSDPEHLRMKIPGIDFPLPRRLRDRG